MNTKFVIGSAVASLLTGSAAAQNTVPVCSESFEYATGGLGGQAGGTGWFNEWYSGGNGDDANVTSPGHDGIGEKITTNWENGGSYRIPESGPHTDIAPDFRFGSGDGVLWMRFSAQRAAGSTDDYGGVSLFEQFVGEKLYIGSPFQTYEWGLADPSTGNVSTAAGSSVDTLSNLVIKLTYGPNGDLAELWVNPGTDYPTTSPDASLALADYAWNEIRMQSGVNNGGLTGYEFDAFAIDKEVDCSTVKYCNPGDGSANNVASIDVPGCDLTGPYEVVLSNAPANQFAYLLIGNGNSVVSQPPGAKGDLCVLGGSCLGRYASDIGAVDSTGTFTTDISNSISGGPGFGIPTCGGNLQSGETWYFQYWHRQPMGQPSTFSEAIGVTFK